MDGKTVEGVMSKLPKLLEQTYINNEFHPEEEGSLKINDSLTGIKNDLLTVDNELIGAASSVDDLIKSTITRLDAIKKYIDYEKDRLQDISMLCNKYTDFDNVIVLKGSDFSGTFTYENNTFSVARGTNSKVEIEITNVIGNGYEGNNYVVSEGDFVKEKLDTSQQKNLKDNSLTNYYEYSRITAANTEEYLNNDFNTDSEEAKCTISLQAKENINEIQMSSSSSITSLINAQYSIDGIHYSSIQFEPIYLNNKDRSYSHYNYVNGSNTLSIPNAKYVKLTFQSNGFNNDICGFTRRISDEGATEVSSELRIVKSARRHAIQIEEIEAFKNEYAMNSTLESFEVKQEGVLSVALFANEYIPQDAGVDSVKFVLAVNGIDYDIVPINSQKNGIKVVRFSQGKTSSKYTQYISEPIKSIRLTIIMSAKKNVTPYINNLKLLIGGEY